MSPTDIFILWKWKGEYFKGFTSSLTVWNFLVFNHSRANPIPTYLWRFKVLEHTRDREIWQWQTEEGSRRVGLVPVLLVAARGWYWNWSVLDCMGEDPTLPWKRQSISTPRACAYRVERSQIPLPASIPCPLGISTPTFPSWLWHREDFYLLRMSQRWDSWCFEVENCYEWWVLSAVTIQQGHQCVADHNSFSCDNSLG